MAISQKRYVDITSGVGGAAAASQRELIARLLTTNSLAPFGKVIEFTSLDDVGGHFGTSSTEYAWAAKYFGFISKDIVMPKKISFARYAPEAIAPQIIATKAPAPIATITENEEVTIAFTVNGEPYSATTITTGMTSYAEMIAIVNDALTDEGGHLQYDSGTNRFSLVASEAGAGTIGYATGNLASLLGLDIASNPINSDGSAAETPVEAITRVAALSDNFGSFGFIETLTAAQIAAVAAWNASAEQNYKYIYSVPVTTSNYAEIAGAASGMTGTCLTLSKSGEYAEYMPCACFAATDYTRTNASRNYMYQQFPGAEALVTTNAEANIYDNLKINYYGATQTTGRPLAFYQRGVLQGNAEDIGVYANEIWMKDAFLTTFFNLLLALNKIPANKDGEAIVRGAMMDTINLALKNGTILPSKTFTTTQKAYIDNLTGRKDSWIEVYNNGYTLDVNVETATENGSTLYKIKYILIYSKGDSIKKIEGTDVLI